MKNMNPIIPTKRPDFMKYTHLNSNSNTKSTMNFISLIQNIQYMSWFLD